MRIDPVTGVHFYSEGDVITDLLYNGNSVIGLQPVGAQYDPTTGYGYVVLLRTLDNPNVIPERLVDGQYITHTYYGTIQIVT